jgi:anaerobic magnesium-protoporphyrin IX monomethyl ester cyclase
MLDVLFITSNNSSGIYQKLSNKYSAIETPTWSLLLAQSCRSKNYKVAILDCLVENLTDEEAYLRIKKLNPRLLCFVVYGQNVNSGTTNMSGAVRLAKYLKNKDTSFKISFVGSHVQALPIETLKKEKEIDFVFSNEGIYALWNILKLDHFTDKNLKKINGIVFRDLNNNIIFNQVEKVVPQSRMDIDMPGYAWDLLPFKKKPFDLYRSPMWHAEYIEEQRTPYAALQTSLGCQFKCEFCMINILNRDDEKEIGVASNYSGMRFWTPEFIIKEFDKLISYGVKTIRIVDEMFLLNPKYYVPICNLLSERNKDDSLRLWAYSRIDTIKKTETLDLVRKAGIKWIALGIESSDKKIRLEASKGKFEDVDIRKIVKIIHEADIDIMANYIYGLPGDTKESINQTFELSEELCTRGWNTYAAMALPGSQLYKNAIEKNIELPENYEGYSFHSYNSQPLPTEKLTAAEVLKIRDEKFIEYHNNPSFLRRIEEKFGDKAVSNIKKMTTINIKRKLYN